VAAASRPQSSPTKRAVNGLEEKVLAAVTGLKPVVEIMYADFILCCMNQIVNVAAKLRYSTGGQLKVPIVIRAMIGQGRGLEAITHRSR